MPFYAQLTIPFFMIITGFTYSLSYEKHMDENWYSFHNFLHKYKRILLPFCPALIIELFVLGVPDSFFVWIVSGGYQLPGSYYVIILIQLILLFPIIRYFYIFCERWKFSWQLGLLITFCFQCLYELVSYYWELSFGIYRLLIFRYFIFVYFGVVLYYQPKICLKKMMFLFPIGFIYIFAVGYMNWQPTILFRYPTWYRSAAPVIFYIAPIITYLIVNGTKLISYMSQNIVGRNLVNILVEMGKASYHVYILQMLWFGLITPHFNSSSWRQIIIFVVSLIVCSLSGVIYYRMENILTKKIQSNRLF